VLNAKMFVSKMKIPTNKNNFARSIIHNKLSKKFDNKLQPQINCDKSPLEMSITIIVPKKQDYKEKE
jgi:hypothetical protein